MNLLAHAVLSFGDGGILTGNMIADDVKGRAILDSYPPGIRHGIILHRKIDEFTDTNPAVQLAKQPFRPTYGLYAGPITDIIMDHYLANDPRYFPNIDALRLFATRCYTDLEANKAFFPERFASMFPHMCHHDWFSGYRSLKGIHRALTSLTHRATHMPPIQEAYDIFVTNFYSLNQRYFELMDSLAAFVKKQIPVCD